MKTYSSSWQLRAEAELERRRRERQRPATTPTAAPEETRVFHPRHRPQELFRDSTADIAIIGGSVFGGKTWSLTFEPTRHTHVPGFTCVTFRRVAPEIRNPGGLWDEASDMYPWFGGKPREGPMEWDFSSGARIKFAGLQYDSTVLEWKSSQICLLQFDQLEEFSKDQFWYMLSRNRSLCGVKPYVRASCNPDPDSFLAEFLAWWIDPHSGYAIPERSGRVRWFIRLDSDELVWADTREDLVDQFPDHGADALSVSFVLATLQDNVIGREKDPHYERKMRALPLVERERLLGGVSGGNWKIRAAAGLVFNRSWFEIVDAVPGQARRARGWDNAASKGSGDWSVGTLLAEAGRIFYVENVVRERVGPDERKKIQRNTALSDGVAVRIRGEQEPGSAGVDAAKDFVKNLNGFTAHTKTSTGSKLVRAGPLSAQVQAGNVKLLRGPWNEAWLQRMNAFPSKTVPDDEIDSVVNAYEELNAWQSHDPGDFRTVKL